MSYLVLSLKYRPQTFKEVIGQDHITTTLTNAFKKDRVSQAYLFTGPRGVGKTTTARLVAKALNCMETPGNPCNKCSNCVEITDGRNMDVLEIDGASNRGIEEIRGLREAIQYSPINSKYKIFIIDEVHMLTTPAFNALLRTLEEPPEHGKFILATTDIYKVPATIISRCQRFDFNSISIKEISKQIKFVLDREKIQIDEDSMKIIAQKADGSMRDALSILDQVIAFSGDKITNENVNKVLGLIPNEMYFEILESIRTKDGGDLINILSEVRSVGMPVQEFITGLNRHLRNMMIGTVNNGLDAIEMNDDLKQKYIESSHKWNLKDLLRISEVVSEIDFRIKKAVQPHILIELSLLKLLELDSTVSIQSILENIHGNISSPLKDNPKNNVANKTRKVSETKSENLSSEGIKHHDSGLKTNKAANKDTENKISESKVSKPSNKIDINSVKNGWENFLSVLSVEKPSVSNVLEHCELGQLAGNRLEIMMVNGNNFNLRTLEKNKMIIEEFLEKVYEVPLRTVFLMTKAKEAKQEEKNQKENLDKTHQATAKLIELFDGEIIT